MPTEDEDEDEFDCGEVLEAGLPPLPAPVPPKEFSVPVARWTGPRFGAVRFLEGYQDEDGYRVDDDVAVLLRTSGGWLKADGGGGTNWYFDEAPLLRRPACAPHSAEVSEEHWAGSVGWTCVAVSGVASVDARWVEVEQGDQTTRRRWSPRWGYSSPAPTPTAQRSCACWTATRTSSPATCSHANPGAPSATGARGANHAALDVGGVGASSRQRSTGASTRPCSCSYRHSPSSG